MNLTDVLIGLVALLTLLADIENNAVDIYAAITYDEIFSKNTLGELITKAFLRFAGGIAAILVLHRFAPSMLTEIVTFVALTYGVAYGVAGAFITWLVNSGNEGYQLHLHLGSRAMAKFPLRYERWRARYEKSKDAARP